MKKHLLLTSFIMLKLVSANAQIIELASHLNGTGTTINQCAGGYCPTYDYQCVVAGCNPILSSGGTWGRIGTPNSSTGFINCIASNGSVEGIFTDFNFIPGEMYHIHVGINAFFLENREGGTSSIPISDAKIKLYATKQLVQTSGSVCCAEKSLIDYSTNQFRNNYHSGGENDWANNNGQNNWNVDGIQIGEFNPGISWFGSTNVFSATFQPSSSSSFGQFAIHPYLNNAGADQNITVLDYVIIERECGAGFGYTMYTNQPSKVNFFPLSNIAANSYNWDFGDGTSSTTGPLVTHTYPTNSNPASSSASYIACQNIIDQYGGECTRCYEICEPSIGRNASCDIISDFQFDLLNPFTYEVRVTPLGSSSTFDINWGDGNISYGVSNAPMPHTYALPGSYSICLTAHGQNSDCYSVTCMGFCLPTFDGSNITETGGDDTGGEGKYSNKSEGDNTQKDWVNTSLGSITITPNPAHENLIIQMPQSISKNVDISVYDFTSRLLINKSEIINDQTNKIKLNIENLPNGAYYIEVKTADDIIKKKIIKQ